MVSRAPRQSATWAQTMALTGPSHTTVCARTSFVACLVLIDRFDEVVTPQLMLDGNGAVLFNPARMTPSNLLSILEKKPL